MKMNRYVAIIITVFLTLIVTGLRAQVGINNPNITASGSAMLDINSSDKGLLIPRLTTAQRDLIHAPATGLLIFNTTTARFNYYNGATWFQIETTFVADATGTVKTGGGVAISSDPNRAADSSAMLDVSDTERGVLVPRTQTSLIAAPVNGLLIYDISDNLFKYYIDNVWQPVCAVTTGQQAVTGPQSAIGVAINTTGAAAHASSMLDVSASDKGILIPRLTTEQRNLLSPVTGLTIFNTTTKTIEFYNGIKWYKMNILLPASVSITSNVTSVCAGNAVFFTATAVNGGTPPGYQWRVNGNPVAGATNANYLYAPANQDVVTCVMTSAASCVSGSPATSNAITITVTPTTPVSVSITASQNPVCSGSGVFFNSSIVNGGTNPQYKWKVNGTFVTGATNATFIYPPVNNDAVACQLTSSAICPSPNPATSNTINMTVNPLLPVSITITPSANPVCAGTQVSYTSE